MADSLERIFSARSIAIIGASNDPSKRGHQAIIQLQKDGFEGRILPINPNTQEILGLKTHRSVLDVNGEIDTALVCTPANTLPDILEQCGQKKIPGVVVLAAGFAEIGESGEELAQKSIEIARRHNVRIVGPNTNGIFNLHNKMNLVGISGVEPGNIGICSQSGNMMLALVNEARKFGVNSFSTYAGVGNQMEVGMDEFLRLLGNDDHTSVIILYVEGIINGRDILNACREVAKIKPVVIFKSGRTRTGQVAAKSHTGSLATGYRLTKCLLRQAGAVVIDESDKVVSVAMGLANSKLPAGGRIAVFADGGGHATIMVDILEENESELAQFSDETSRKLESILPQTATSSNPVDVAGGTDTTPEVNADCAAVILADNNVDILVLVGMYGGFSERFDPAMQEREIETSKRLVDLAARYGKPIIVQSIFSDINPEPLQILKDGGIPVFFGPEHAASCISELVNYSKFKFRVAEPAKSTEIKPSVKAQGILGEVTQAMHPNLLEHEALDLLSEYGIKVPDFVVANSESELDLVPKLFGYVPVAMKVLSRDVLHKSDAGCVRLNVAGEKDILQSFHDIIINAKKFAPTAEIRGVIISPMSKPGVETVIGITQDSTFGPVLMFGSGGIHVEVLKDVSFRSLPVCQADLHEMMLETRLDAILSGQRGYTTSDRQALAELMLKVSQIALVHPEIKEIDLNPIIVRPGEYDIVDARMRIYIHW